MTAPNTADMIERARQLYGSTSPPKPRSAVAIVGDIHRAAIACETTSRGWCAILPRRGAITDMQAHLGGMQRLLTELALAMEGGPSNGSG